MIDFVVKSQIMNSVLMSYRFYNGEFCTKEDLKINYINKPYKEYKTALKEWNKGVSLYSIQSLLLWQLYLHASCCSTPSEVRIASSSVEL